MSKFIDLTGKRFGMLTVKRLIGKTEPTPKWRNTFPLWECECDCGEIVNKSSPNLIHDGSKQCGKHKKSMPKKHGMSGTRLYYIWQGMKDRCFNKNNSEYKNYGFRGIVVSDEWLGGRGFVAFRDWAMENGYNDNMTIERIDVDGDYCPRNCSWIEKRKQANNKRNTIRITYSEETKSLKEWCSIFGRNYYTTYSRYKSGYDVDELFENKDYRTIHSGNKKQAKVAI